jgi:hypothetical protein
MLLIEKDLWEAITKDSPTEKVSLKALSCIVLNTKKHHHSLLAKAETAKEAWGLLKNLFGTQGNAGRMRLMRELFDVKMKDSSMAEYVGKVRDLRDKLNEIEGEMSEAMAVLFLLNGLGAEYDMYKTVMMTQKEEVTFESAFEILLQAEIAVKPPRDHDKLNVRLFNARSIGTSHERPPPVCWTCGGTGHIKRDCPKNQVLQGKKDERHPAVM